MKDNKAIILFGPTASGKTGLSVKLAKELGATVVNADSRQIYRDLPVLTATPTAAEQDDVPHKLFGVRELTQKFTVADYMTEAQAAVVDIKLPLFVGGTGFYIDGLLNGLSPIPEVPEEVEADVQKRLDAEGVEALYAALAKVDSALAARLHSTDTQRVFRGLAVYEGTGTPLSEWQKLPKIDGLDRQFIKVALAPPREQVTSNIEKRFEQMLADGVLDEVKAVVEKFGGVEKLPSQTIHGLRELAAHVAGEMTLDDARESIVIQTRQYAKRQMTWLRNSYGADVILENADADTAVQKLGSFLSA